MNADLGQRWILVLAVFVWLVPPAAAGRELGMVMDVSGDAEITRGGDTLPSDIGSVLFHGDSISLGDGSNLALVSYHDCMEWSFAGPDTVHITTTATAAPSRKPPVCYRPEEARAADSSVMGRFAPGDRLRDPVAPLREEFETGRASNAALVTIILHDLKKGRVEKARPYYRELRRRAPHSIFVSRMAEIFQGR